METQMMEHTLDRSVTHLFDEQVYLTGIIEYGVSWDDVVKGQATAPRQGARFDIAFEGSISGETINGSIKGIDYLTIRADGTFLLDIHATIVTDDGETIALKENGMLTPVPSGNGQLHLNMQCSTASPNYRWLNAKQIWGIGDVDMAAGVVTVKGFMN